MKFISFLVPDNKPITSFNKQTNKQTNKSSNYDCVYFVKEFRNEISILGTRKLLSRFSPHLTEHRIEMDRDQLFALLQFNDLLI